jgi:hypothetical protein
MKFIKENIAALTLPAGKAEHKVWDDDLPRFGIRLQGRKRTWIIQYRVGTQQRRLSLGSIDTVELAKARKVAKEALAEVALGRDPQMEKAERQEQASLTFGSVVERYLAARK